MRVGRGGEREENCVERILGKCVNNFVFQWSEFRPFLQLKMSEFGEFPMEKGERE